MTRAVYDLLEAVEAHVAEGPVFATSQRHVSHGLGDDDPLLFAHLYTFQSESFRPGAYVWAAVDPTTGQPGPLEVAVVDHPLDRHSAFAAARQFLTALSAHLDGPYLARTDKTGTTVDPDDRDVLPDVLPRVVVANGQVIEMFRRLGRYLSYQSTRTGNDAAAAEALVAQLRHGGNWLRELAQIAQRAGQSQIIDACAQLTDLYVVPLPQGEQSHLGAVLGAIAAGQTGGWEREHLQIGPELDPDEQTRLWQDHIELREAARRGDTATAGHRRAALEARYRGHAEVVAGEVASALCRLDAVCEEPTFAAERRHEGLQAYVRAGRFLLGRYGGRRRAVQAVTDNDRRLAELQLAREVNELRRLVSEPWLRAPLWARGEVAEGRRVGASSHMQPTGGQTPTGRPERVTAVDVVLQAPEEITLPAVGTELLWGRDRKLETVGTVTEVCGRQVTIQVIGKGVRAVERPDWNGQHDVWVAASPPYTGPQASIPAEELPATHRSPRSPEPLGAPDAGADAVLSITENAGDRNYS